MHNKKWKTYPSAATDPEEDVLLLLFVSATLMGPRSSGCSEGCRERRQCSAYQILPEACERAVFVMHTSVAFSTTPEIRDRFGCSCC